MLVKECRRATHLPLGDALEVQPYLPPANIRRSNGAVLGVTLFRIA